MLRAGLSPDIVLAKIKSSPSNFDTSPAALAALKAADVPDAVVLAMIQASSGREGPEGTAPPARQVDQLTALYEKLQNCVVTVWSEVGHGTGFIVAGRGLILTNQHVIGPSELISVQFDSKRKVRAVLLAADPEKDVAVLWANLSAFPRAAVAPLAPMNSKEPPVVEGERVFTIGSPLSQRKILTTGVASKVEARAIISDININPGNSGGPLFNSLGQVVGLTTFREGEQGGPGIAGIIRIEEAAPLLQQARASLAAAAELPSPALLPVEPTDSFPLNAIKEAVLARKFDTRPYFLTEGDYDVAVITPVFKYWVQNRGGVAEAREKAKRTRNKRGAVQSTFKPLEDLKNWAEYAGQYKPVVQIEAAPKLRETFWSAFGRGLAASGGRYGGPARMHFKTDFYRMRLLCGAKEVAPIHPSKAAERVDVRNPFVSVTDATYVGIYAYPPDAISPACGKVTLELYSEKSPEKPTVKVLSTKTVERVWKDFAPYRDSSAKAEPPK
jgi:S1-C subfamily serine protease